MRRLDIHVGKFDLVDFFDLNSVANDSHMQFMNWTVVNNGAYDYAADTRGYTYGGVIDYEDRCVGFSLRRGPPIEAAQRPESSKEPAGRAFGELRTGVSSEIAENRETAVRLLAFTNFSNMGDYNQAIDLFEERKTPSRRSPTIRARRN